MTSTLTKSKTVYVDTGNGRATLAHPDRDVLKVTITPNGVLVMSEKGARRKYTLPLSYCYRLACKGDPR